MRQAVEAFLCAELASTKFHLAHTLGHPSLGRMSTERMTLSKLSGFVFATCTESFYVHPRFRSYLQAA